MGQAPIWDIHENWGIGMGIVPFELAFGSFDLQSEIWQILGSGAVRPEKIA